MSKDKYEETYDECNKCGESYPKGESHTCTPSGEPDDRWSEED